MRSDTIPATSRVLVAVLAVSTLVRLYLAATSGGVDDVYFWFEFADGVREHGPIGIYGHPFTMQYNHPPLAGWFLVLVNAGSDLGINMAYLVRIPSSLADAVTCWLVYRLLTDRVGPRWAAAAAAGIALSPALVVISGYHGNTDPVFVALVLLAFHLLTRRERPFGAGVCIALAISLKLVPVVALPWLLFLAFRLGRATLVRLVCGGALVFAVLWVPVLLLAWPEFRDNVLGYAGVPLRQWGPGEILQWLGHPGADAWLGAHAAGAALVASCVPFIARWTRRESQDSVGLGLSLVSMLLLTPAFGMQYLAWGLAAAYLVSVRGAWLFNVAASIFVLQVYARWSGGGPPWEWGAGGASALTVGELLLMTLTWTSLLVVWIQGLLPVRAELRDREPAQPVPVPVPVPVTATASRS